MNADEHQQQLSEQRRREFDESIAVTETQLNRTTTMDLNSLSFDQLVPKNSKYLSKEDVGEDGVILTIKGFKIEEVGEGDELETKTVMYFVENVKPMVLNRTNAQLIKIATGAETAGDARGKQVVVFNDPTVGYAGKITGGVRIKKLAGQPKPFDGPEGDGIPF